MDMGRGVEQGAEDPRAHYFELSPKLALRAALVRYSLRGKTSSMPFRMAGRAAAGAGCRQLVDLCCGHNSLDDYGNRHVRFCRFRSKRPSPTPSSSMNS